tara:strand:- start:29 stop:298 length:270 start_codon:yes stop_codon:yes gene_type:complete
MFSNKLIKKEYEKNLKFLNMIKQDKNIDDNIKKRYLEFLKKEDEEIKKEKKIIEETIDNLRKIYEHITDEYLKTEIKNNINEILNKYKY